MYYSIKWIWTWKSFLIIFKICVIYTWSTECNRKRLNAILSSFREIEVWHSHRLLHIRIKNNSKWFFEYGEETFTTWNYHTNCNYRTCNWRKSTTNDRPNVEHTLGGRNTSNNERYINCSSSTGYHVSFFLLRCATWKTQAKQLKTMNVKFNRFAIFLYFSSFHHPLYPCLIYGFSSVESVFYIHKNKHARSVYVEK